MNSWNSKNECGYCHLSFISGKHKSEDHLGMKINLIDLPLDVIQQLKAHYVKTQQFEKAAQVREFEKVILLSENIISK